MSKAVKLTLGIVVIVIVAFIANSGYKKYNEEHITKAFRSSAIRAIYAADRITDANTTQQVTERYDEAMRLVAEAHVNAETQKDHEVAADLDHLASGFRQVSYQLASGLVEAPGEASEVAKYKQSLVEFQQSNRDLRSSLEESLK